MDGEGFLFVHGRLDDVIVRGGENLSSGEIESVLLSHPAVEAAAVVGVPDEEWGERVVAAVVLHQGASAGEDELRDHVRAELRSAPSCSAAAGPSFPSGHQPERGRCRGDQRADWANQ